LRMSTVETIVIDTVALTETSVILLPIGKIWDYISFVNDPACKLEVRNRVI
jgi:hypothetical protein